MVVIGSSDKEGVVYIETGALDGEKNLKPRGAMPETQGYFKDHMNIDTSVNLYVQA